MNGLRDVFIKIGPGRCPYCNGLLTLETNLSMITGLDDEGYPCQSTFEETQSETLYCDNCGTSFGDDRLTDTFVRKDNGRFQPVVDLGLRLKYGLDDPVPCFTVMQEILVKNKSVLDFNPFGRYDKK